MSFYDDMAATAKQLLTDYGRDVTVRQFAGGGGYDPATAQNAAGAATDTVAKGAIFDFGSGQTQFQGSLIEKGDKKLLLEAKVVPTLADRIIAGADTFTVVGIRSANPAGTPVAYSLHLRK